MPILGILASSKLIAAAGDYESIATVTVGSGGAANVEFTSIAADWTHLQIRAICRDNRSGGNYDMYAQFNSDTGSNYASHNLKGDGSSATAGASTSATKFTVLRDSLTTANITANTFSGFVLDILDYKNTNKYKTVRTLGGFDANGSGVISFTSGLWMNTSAITSIKIFPELANNFVQYSHFALYGIKGA